eukprot:4241160-Prymnesium_polylepis.1
MHAATLHAAVRLHLHEGGRGVDRFGRKGRAVRRHRAQEDVIVVVERHLERALEEQLDVRR